MKSERLVQALDALGPDAEQTWRMRQGIRDRLADGNPQRMSWSRLLPSLAVAASLLFVGFTLMLRRTAANVPEPLVPITELSQEEVERIDWLDKSSQILDLVPPGQTWFVIRESKENDDAGVSGTTRAGVLRHFDYEPWLASVEQQPALRVLPERVGSFAFQMGTAQHANRPGTLPQVLPEKVIAGERVRRNMAKSPDDLMVVGYASDYRDAQGTLVSVVATPLSRDRMVSLDPRERALVLPDLLYGASGRDKAEELHIAGFEQVFLIPAAAAERYTWQLIAVETLAEPFTTANTLMTDAMLMYAAEQPQHKGYSGKETEQFPSIVYRLDLVGSTDKQTLIDFLQAMQPLQP